MGRLSASLLIAAWILFHGVGCLQTGKVGPLAWMRSKKKTQSRDDDNPFKSSRFKKNARDSKSNRSAIAGVGNGSHDAATLRLMERELRDASTSERRQLTKDLEGRSPQFVQSLLRQRRLALQWVNDARNRKRRDEDFALRNDALPHDTDRVGRNSVRDNSAATEIGHSGTPRFDATAPYSGLGTNPWSDDRRTLERRDVRFSRAKRFDDSAAVRSSTEKAGFRRFDDRRDRTGQDRTGQDRIESRRVENTSSFNLRSVGYDSEADSRVNPNRSNRNGSFGRTDDRNRDDRSRDDRSRDEKRYRLLPSPENRFTDTAADQRDTRTVGNTAQLPAPLPANRNTTGTGRTQEWQDALERLIAIADSNASKSLPGKTAKEQFEYTQKHVFLRMLFLMAGKHQQAMEPIRGIDLADQEFWSQTMWALSNYFQSDNIPDSEERASQTIAQLRSAIQRLQQNAKLEIRNLSFCRKITNFGNYEKYERDEFRAGEKVLVYVEVANFKSEFTDGGKYRTVLKSEIEISKVTSSGSGLIEKFRFDPTEDLCRNRRQDYFHSYEITIPKAASKGPHVLKLIIVDQQGQRIATETINFTVR